MSWFRFGILFLLLLTLVTGCSTGSENHTSLRIVYGLTLEASGWDPHINQSAELGIVLRQVYDTLVYRHPETKEIVPGLAANWTLSSDGLVYTFNLRTDVTFHDGTPFNAQAVAANIDRIRDPETASQRALFLLGPLDRYEVVDDSTIRFILREPFSAFLDSLSQVYLAIASPRALDEYNLLRYQYHQVGTGPFEFVEYLPGDRIVIRRNPDYAWGPEFYTEPGENAVQEVVFRFYRDPATRAAALENGDAQIMGELLPSDARLLLTNSSIRLVPVPVPGQPLQFYFNTTQSPTDNINLRRALLYGTNRIAIADAIYQGFSPVAWGPISASTLYYTRNVTNYYVYDSGQAQSLLFAMGYSDSDRDGWLDLNGERLELRMIVPNWGLVPEVAQMLQDQWRTIGVRLVLEPVPGFTALRARVESGEYNLVAFDAFGVDPSILNPRFLSSGADNWTGFGSLELDNILLEAARQSDPTVRRNLYGQAQRVIMEQALILPIRDYVNLNAHSTAVQGLVFEPIGWFPLLHNVTIQHE